MKGPARTLWTVTHPERLVRIEVPARSVEEARQEAWKRWYRRPVQTEFDALLRAAFATQDTGRPADEEGGAGAEEAECTMKRHKR